MPNNCFFLHLHDSVLVEIFFAGPCYQGMLMFEYSVFYSNVSNFFFLDKHASVIVKNSLIVFKDTLLPVQKKK